MAKFFKEIYKLRPWYHDFAKLDLQTDFSNFFKTSFSRMISSFFGYCFKNTIRVLSAKKPRSCANLGKNYIINQKYKDQYIVPFLKQALTILPQNPECLDLFCSDGYHSCLIKKYKPDADVIGIDIDSNYLQQARMAVKVLGYQSVKFVEKDVYDFVKQSIAHSKSYDLILCTGGLYHLLNPGEFLRLLVQIVKKFLIIQTVVTLETEESNYFISPAPGWKHGSRFTHAGIKQWLLNYSLSIVREGRNELRGNKRLCDKGSSYFLCEKKQEISKN